MRNRYFSFWSWMLPISLTMATGLISFQSRDLAADDQPEGKEKSSQAEAVDFARDIEPIFKTHCYKCHGPKKQEGGLRLDHRGKADHQQSCSPVACVHGAFPRVVQSFG